MNKQKSKAAVLCLCSNQYLPWSRAQEQRLKELEPTFIYRRVTEENLRSDPEATQYPEIVRLLCANRPKEVLKLFKEGFDEVLFVGADIYFMHSFKHMFEGNDHKDALVTSHITKPIPNDGYYPTTNQIHRTGQLNSDFVLWRNTPNTIEFLEWQAEQLEKRCEDNISAGYFYDQIYLSFAPYFLWTGNLTNQGFNVAYWNLHEAPPGYLDKQYCFQFSGFSLDNPATLSKYTNRPTIQTMEVFKLMQEFVAYLEPFLKETKDD